MIFFFHLFLLFDTIYVTVCAHYFDFCMTFLNVLQLYLTHPLLHWWTPKLLLDPAAIRIKTSLDVPPISSQRFEKIYVKFWTSNRIQIPG